MKSKTKSINKKPDGWEYFDDCLICEAMRKADEEGRNLSERELRDAFREANKRQKEAK